MDKAQLRLVERTSSERWTFNRFIRKEGSVILGQSITAKARYIALYFWEPFFTQWSRSFH